eukprot:15798-Pelagococcus_subviridis.AAC.1
MKFATRTRSYGNSHACVHQSQVSHRQIYVCGMDDEKQGGRIRQALPKHDLIRPSRDHEMIAD